MMTDGNFSLGFKKMTSSDDSGPTIFSLQPQKIFEISGESSDSRIDVIAILGARHMSVKESPSKINCGLSGIRSNNEVWWAVWEQWMSIPIWILLNACPLNSSGKSPHFGAGFSLMELLRAYSGNQINSQLHASGFDEMSRFFNDFKLSKAPWKIFVIWLLLMLSRDNLLKSPLINESASTFAIKLFDISLQREHD